MPEWAGPADRHLRLVYIERFLTQARVTCSQAGANGWPISFETHSPVWFSTSPLGGLKYSNTFFYYKKISSPSIMLIDWHPALAFRARNSACGGKWWTADQMGHWCAAQARGHHVRRQAQCCWLFFFRDSVLLWVYVYVWAILIFKSGQLIKHVCELGYKCTGYQCNLSTLFWCLQPHVKNTREIRK